MMMMIIIILIMMVMVMVMMVLQAQSKQATTPNKPHARLGRPWAKVRPRVAAP